MAVTRIYLGAHWTTDTIAGMLTGLIWVFVYSATTEAVTRAKARRAPLAARNRDARDLSG